MTEIKKQTQKKVSSVKNNVVKKKSAVNAVALRKNSKTLKMIAKKKKKNKATDHKKSLTKTGAKTKMLAKGKAVYVAKKATSVKTTVKLQTKKQLKHARIETIDKKINTTLAVAIILLLGIVMGGLIFWGSKKEVQMIQQTEAQANDLKQTVLQNNASKDKTGMAKNEKIACAERAFEGQAEIRGWYVDEAEDGAVLINVQLEDLKALPVFADMKEEELKNSIFKIVNGSTEFAENFKKASGEKPFRFAIKSFTYKCNEAHILRVEM